MPYLGPLTPGPSVAGAALVPDELSVNIFLPSHNSVGEKKIVLSQYRNNNLESDNMPSAKRQTVAFLQHAAWLVFKMAVPDLYRYHRTFHHAWTLHNV